MVHKGLCGGIRSSNSLNMNQHVLQKFLAYSTKCELFISDYNHPQLYTQG